MALGDSITEGTPEGGPYLPCLAQKLREEGYCFTFVGSRCAPPEHQAGDTLPIRHEGHGGWLAHDFALRPEGGDESHGRLDQWLQTYRPDLVLLHVGTNDLICSYSPAKIVEAIGAIIAIIRPRHPGAEVFVAKPIPLYDHALGEDYGDYLGLPYPTTFAAGVKALHAALDTTELGEHVTIVDVAAGWDPEADLTDGIHPSRSGNRKIAARWMQAIRERYSPNSIAP